MGARSCNGGTFAMTLATLTTAFITSRWHLEPAPGTDTHPSIKFIALPGGPCGMPESVCARTCWWVTLWSALRGRHPVT